MEDDQVILWPREADYPRFVEVSDDSPPATYVEFVARAQPIFDGLRAQGCKVLIVEPDPDLMAEWCRAKFGRVSTNSRAAYAAYVALNKPSAEDQIN